MNIIIMQITVNYRTKQFTSKVHFVIPVESAGHHVVVNELPFPPKIHGTVELEEKIKGKAGFKGGDVIKELG